MKGTLLNYNLAESLGIITGDDGNRYIFQGLDWKENELPQKGMSLDFIPVQNSATEVYIDTARSSFSNTNHSWYKSSNNKVLAGVCAGIAHKQNVSCLGLRVATVLLSILFIFPILVYIALWLFLPEQSSKR